MEVKAFRKTITAAANVQAADTSQIVYIFALPPDCYPLAFRARVKTAFAGVTTPSVELGITGRTTHYIPQQPINKVGELLSGAIFSTDNICPKQHSPDVQASGNGQRNVFATFRSASGNLSSLSAGEIDFVVVYAE